MAVISNALESPHDDSHREEGEQRELPQLRYGAHEAERVRDDEDHHRREHAAADEVGVGG